MLDALQDLKPGEVSRVVETDLGFHVVRRLELPRDQSVQGQEIVVSYRGIPTKARADRAASAEVRELDAARALAKGLLERTRAGADFAALAREFSDASSAEAGGDIGWHSIYEARIEVTFDTLAELQPGQISDLIDDGLDGFRILKRTNVGSPTVAEAAAKEPHEFEMPAPPVPDELNSSVAQLVWYIENFKAEASARFTFTDGEALAFASILEEFAEDVRRSSEPARRTQALSKLHEQLTVAFGAKEAAELIGFERNHRASLLGMNY
jgi:hypothetical protein